jgi:hypothetical protein
MRITRRAFLETTAAGVAVAALGGRARAQQAPPSDQIVLGMIGVGGMGSGRRIGVTSTAPSPPSKSAPDTSRSRSAISAACWMTRKSTRSRS